MKLPRDRICQRAAESVPERLPVSPAALEIERFVRQECCDHLFTVRKESLDSLYGRVTQERRRALSRTLHRAFALLP